MLFGALWLILFMATQHANCNTNNSNNGGANREQRQIGRLWANQGQVFGCHLSGKQRVAVRAIISSNCMSICSSSPAPAGKVGRTTWSLRTYICTYACLCVAFVYMQMQTFLCLPVP